MEAWLKSYSTASDRSVKIEPGVTTGTDLGALSVTTVATNQQPRISLFYGDKVKGQATYDQWVYEVKCLFKEETHKPEVIAQAIRRSLRGDASNLVRRLGIGSSIPDILDKFKSVYGATDTNEYLLAKFYSAKQDEDEDVTKCSCGLEDILASVVERQLVDTSKVNEMLHNMFYQGLKPTLKDISGYKFSKLKTLTK